MSNSSFLSKIRKNFSGNQTPVDEGQRIRKILGWICDILLALVFLFSIALEAINPFNYIAIFIFVLFCIAAFIYILLYGRFFFDIYLALILIFLLSQYIATIVNLFPEFTQTGTLMCLMSFAIYYYLRQKSVSKKRILCLFIISALIFFIIFTSIYYKEIIHPNFSIRIGDFFGNQNDVARHLSFTAILFLVFVALNNKIIFKVLGYLFYFLTFYLILLTGSISNLFVILIVLLIHLFMSYTKTKKSILIYVFCTIGTVALLFVLIFTVPALSYFKTRIIDMFTSLFGNYSSISQGDRSSEGRMLGALYGFKIFIQNPLFGNGYNATYRSYHIMSHNNITEVAANFGIIGLIAEELIILLPLFKSNKRDQKIFLIIIYITIFQLFLVSFNAKVESILIPFCYSMIDNDKLRLPNIRNKTCIKEIKI